MKTFILFVLVAMMSANIYCFTNHHFKPAAQGPTGTGIWAWVEGRRELHELKSNEYLVATKKGGGLTHLVLADGLTQDNLVKAGKTYDFQVYRTDTRRRSPTYNGDFLDLQSMTVLP